MSQLTIPATTATEAANVSFSRPLALAVAAEEARDSAVGLILGFIVVLIGAVMVFGGVAGSTIIKLPGGVEVTTTVPGVAFAVIGFAIIFVTRPKVVAT